MNERFPVSEINPHFKEISDIIPKPENQYHYTITGDWQVNREVYRVMEEDNVVSDYNFPDKSDLRKVQYATRKTYMKTVNFLGIHTDQPVQFDKKYGLWKKLTLVQKVKQAFSKETNIPAIVIDGVLHTLEQKRPVGKAVRESTLESLADIHADIGLKFKPIDQKIRDLEKTAKILKTEVAAGAASAVALERQLSRANTQIAELAVQLRAEQTRVQELKNQANPLTPDPNDVVEGEVIG